MGAVAWLEAQVGKEIDYDNAFGVQCVDLAMAYYDHLGVPISRGNGDDYQDNALPEGWQRIQDGEPLAGDILVYVAADGTRNAGDDNLYSYGHVGIMGDGETSYHEFPDGKVVKFQWGYKNAVGGQYRYWGCIRPDFRTRDAVTPTAGDMYRCYNPNSGEHFYTGSTVERDAIVALGWNYEGVGWTAPEKGDPVYRMYNPNAGEHHYTTSAAEKNALADAGWDYEGIGWYSADAATGVPMYREYNSNAYACNHNYTGSKTENDTLVSLGWKEEGIAWYGVQK
jgi:hypothetical protein